MFDWYFLSQNLNITLTINVFSYSLFIGKAGLERQEWRQQFMYFLPWRESMINYAVRCTVRWRSLAALCLDLRSDVTLLELLVHWEDLGWSWHSWCQLLTDRHQALPAVLTAQLEPQDWAVKSSVRPQPACRTADNNTVWPVWAVR